MLILDDETCRKHLFDDLRVMLVSVRLAFRSAQLLLQVLNMCLSLGVEARATCFLIFELFKLRSCTSSLGTYLEKVGSVALLGGHSG